jgi:hypothetical protein
MPRRPPSPHCLTLAAELRIGGSTWEAIAARLRRSPETVRRWPREYPDHWRQATSEAERRLAAEAEAEAVVILRQLLCSADDKLRWHAAKDLIRLRVELARLDLRRSRAAEKATTSDAARRPGANAGEQPARPVVEEFARTADRPRDSTKPTADHPQ